MSVFCLASLFIVKWGKQLFSMELKNYDNAHFEYQLHDRTTPQIIQPELKII